LTKAIDYSSGNIWNGFQTQNTVKLLTYVAYALIILINKIVVFEKLIYRPNLLSSKYLSGGNTTAAHVKPM